MLLGLKHRELGELYLFISLVWCLAHIRFVVIHLEMSFFIYINQSYKFRMHPARTPSSSLRFFQRAQKSSNSKKQL